MRRHVFLRVVDAISNHDEYFRMRLDATLECLQRFVKGICEIFREARGFPGMLGSIDCMHWEWKNCPLLHHKTCGFGMHFLELQVRIMILLIQYNMGYYLADDIYPDFTTFVKTISMPQGEKRKLFAQRQESTRKDVKRAFGSFNLDLQSYEVRHVFGMPK
uniref:Uncharacterized protein n=1 Tax=Cajanus cajan TaxID=3821 RepID=A0A151TFQ6_CAJCA|nr:hypothetical protein KK1_012152 [Cajanus cajan]